ncbi:MAG TPA: FAD:protein FMN transferase [Solimonas sp.]
MTVGASAFTSPSPSRLRPFGRYLLTGGVLVLLFVGLALRPRAGPDPRLAEREFIAMSTLMSISVYRDTNQTDAEVERALDAAQAQLRDDERDWSAWGDGALAALNQTLAAGKAVTIPQPLRPLFARAALYGQRSEGRFDVRIGRLIALWGFDDERHFRSQPPPPAARAAALADLHAAPALDAAATTYGPAPGVHFDFGAIAKGDAVDRVVARLRDAGFAHVIVNAGGNLRAAGRRGDRAWRIGIRHPRPDAGSQLLATLEIDGDEAVVTSGDYERGFEFEGRRYHHLIDPFSGEPARGLQAVTVVADNAALADAASTALFIAGPQHWRSLVGRLGLDRVMVVTDDGRVHATPRLAARLRYADGIAATVAP